MNRCKKRHEPVHDVHHSHKAEGQPSVRLAADGLQPGAEADTAALVDAALPAAREAVDRLLSAVAWADEPSGVRIVPVAPKGTWGLAKGSGHCAAIVEGYGGGVAVYVQARGLLGRWLARAGDMNRRGSAAAVRWRSEIGNVGTVEMMYVAIHEVAHTLAAARDTIPPTSADMARCRDVVSQPYSITAAADIAWHGPAWAAAYAIMLHRACIVRETDAELLALFAAHDAAGYGIDLAAVLDAVGPVEPDAPIRPLLADAALLARVEATMPPLEARVAMLASKRSTAPGVPAVVIQGDDSGGAQAASVKGTGR